MAQYQDYSELEIGLTTAGLTAVIDLQYSGAAANVPPPQVTFQAAAEFEDVADGGIKMLGKPIIRWTWPAGSSYTARKAMRQFITTGFDAAVYIVSPDDQGDLQTYAAVMRWPRESYALQSFKFVQPFTIEFSRRVEQ